MNKVKIICRALIIDNQKGVLFVKKRNSDFWILPGGKLETDDLNLQACLIRELQEEIGVDAVITNFRFVQELHKDDTRFVELIWETTLNNNSIYTQQNISEMTNYELIDIQWINKDDLQNANIKPEFLKNIFQ